MSTLEVNSLQHLDASVNNIDLDSSGNATVNGNMTATEFYGGGGNLTGVGVDGIVSTANATAITIDVNENVGFSATPETWESSFVAVQIGNAGAIAGRSSSNHMTVSANTYTSASGDPKYINTDYASHYQMHDGKHTFKVAASGSADANISFTTGFEVLNDGKARAKNGLLFGTDTATANALDDYEEGSWTPTIGGESSAGTYTYLSRSGTYTKVGDLVTVMGYFCNITGSPAGSGVSYISGLPFAPRGFSNSYGPVGAVVATYCTISGTLVVWPYSSSVLYIIDVRSGQDRTHWPVTSLSSGSSDMGFTVTYHTNS